MVGTAAGMKATKAHDQAGLPAQDAVWVLEQAAADQQRSTRRFALRWLPTSLPPFPSLPLPSPSFPSRPLPSPPLPSCAGMLGREVPAIMQAHNRTCEH